MVYIGAQTLLFTRNNTPPSLMYDNIILYLPYKKLLIYVQRHVSTINTI